jgi:hypothetical protein
MRIRHLLQKEISFFFILFIINSVVFGLLIPFLGFYWDDLPYLWFRYIAGVGGVMKALAMDRPPLAVFYAIPMSVLGNHPFGWQIYAIFARFVFATSIYFFLMNLWPEEKTGNKLITLLILVYPGFSQQWISAIYSHAFIIFSLYFYGMSLFIKYLKAHSRAPFLLILSLVIPVFCLTATEYLLGLEMMRPFIIYKIINDNEKSLSWVSIIKKAFIKYLPFLIMLVLFILYRVFLVSSVLYKVQNLDDLFQNPLVTVGNLIKQQFINLNTATFGAYSQIVKPISSINPDSILFKVYLAFLIIMVLFSFIALKYWALNSESHTEDTSKKKWITEAILGSTLILIAAGLPFWAANLVPGLSFPYDRLLLPFMLPASVFMVSLLSILLQRKNIFFILFSLLFGFSAAFHVYMADLYRNGWDDFRQFFFQVSERIPSLEEDTILVTDELPLTFYSDNSLSTALNWLYADQYEVGKMPYLINYTKARLGSSLPSLEANTNINQKYRIVQFKGTTNQMIVFYHQPPGCVHMCDPDLDPYNPLLPTELKSAAALSNLNQIKPDFIQNELPFIKKEQNETWCAYYQKASLALQMGDYQSVASLGDIAFSLDDYPNDASERLPFIESYAYTGQWKKALQLTDATHNVSALYDPMICALWRRIDQESQASNEKENSLSYIQGQFGCDLNP